MLNPCGSFVRADECICPNASAPSIGRVMPKCMPTAACGLPWRRPQRWLHQLHRPSTAFVIFFDFDPSRVRAEDRDDPARAYAEAMALTMRLVLSLKSVRATLPVHLIASGRHQAAHLEALAREGVIVESTTDSWEVPAWASQRDGGSFSKLRALGLRQFRKVIVLDHDLVVLRNIDHLAGAPTPSMVYRPLWKNCQLRVELNSGLMVLAPSLEGHARLQAYLRPPSQRPDAVALPEVEVVAGDRSDQAVWRAALSQAHCLPVAYNAARSLGLGADWNVTFVLHDLSFDRRKKQAWAKLAGSSLAEHVEELGAAARARLPLLAQAVPRGTPFAKVGFDLAPL